MSERMVTVLKIARHRTSAASAFNALGTTRSTQIQSFPA